LQADSKTIDVNYRDIIRTIVTLDTMSQPQRKATIKHILRVNKI